MSKMNLPLVDVLLSNMETSELEILLETMDDMEQKQEAPGKQDHKMEDTKKFFPKCSNVATLPPTLSSKATSYDSSKRIPGMKRKDSELSSSNNEVSSPKKTKKPRSWKKPEGKPKRPLSAYNIFFHHERTRMVRGQTFGSPTRMGFSGMAKEVAAKWKKLGLEQKSTYMKLAKIEKGKYFTAVQQWKEEKVRQGEKEILQMKMQKCYNALDRVTSMVDPEMFVNIPSRSINQKAASVNKIMAPNGEPNRPARTSLEKSTSSAFIKIEDKVKIPVQAEFTHSAVFKDVEAPSKWTKNTTKGGRQKQGEKNVKKLHSLTYQEIEHDCDKKKGDDEDEIIEPLDAQSVLDHNLWTSLDRDSVDFLLSLDFSL